MPNFSNLNRRPSVLMLVRDSRSTHFLNTRARLQGRCLRPFLLCLALTGVNVPVQAQNSAQTSTRSTDTKNRLPLLLGGVFSGMILGAALAAALRKPHVIEKSGIPDPVFENAATPFALVDNREYITKCNAAFAHYFGVDDATGKPLPNFLHPDDLAPVRVELHLIYDGDKPSFSQQARLFRTDGTLLHAQLTLKKADSLRKPQSVLVTLEDHTGRVNAENELIGARDAIRALYEVMSSDKSDSLDEKMKSLLAMGCGRFDLPIGVLGLFSHTEESGDIFETLFVQSPDKRIRPAMTLSRANTQSIESKLLGLAKLPNGANWKQYPYVSSNEEIAYLGSPVLVEGKLFGMLSFSSIERRPEGFIHGEIELLQLMAEWVGGEIERENTRAALEKQQSELLSANLKLEAMATHDALTEAKNRRAFNDKLAEEWSRATRYGTSLSLIMMDVDKFKNFNDDFGHQAGDGVLKRVAAIAMGAIRTTDFFARYGGEEFALILPNTDIEGAMILAERLRAKIEGGGWRERVVTASFGVACSEPNMRRAEDLTEAADKALYASKERGRNRVTHASEMGTSTEPGTVKL
jgi:diguanylate cyclase (GGDEF)-like protein/PAS domain S-box-containing protein